MNSQGSQRLAYDLKKYYSERNECEDTSEEECDAKQNIRALLLGSSLKLDKKEVKEKPTLFDYKEQLPTEESKELESEGRMQDDIEFEQNNEPTQSEGESS